MVFTSRTQAGILLSGDLIPFVRPQTVIVGLSRGGVIVARAIADARLLPLDVLVVKKIPSPHDPEYAIGAVVSDGSSVVRWSDALRTGADEAYVLAAKARIVGALKQKEHRYRRFYASVSVRERPVIIVDDGAATGLTMEAAIVWARRRNASRVTVALPVAAREAYRRLLSIADDCAVHTVSDDLTSVGAYFEHFPQVSDDEVADALAGGKKSG